METKQKIDVLTETFRARFDQFTNGCDCLEDVSFWNLDEYGEMDVYFLNEILSIILRLIIVDGKISAREVEYLNKNFGFSYTKQELEEVCDTCQDELYDSFENRIKSDLDLLKSSNTKLVDEFKALIQLICEIISESDESITLEEKNEMEIIKRTISNS